VKGELDALGQKVGQVEREASKMDSEARDLTRGSGNGGGELAYVRERKRLLDGYTGWLRDYSAKHPAKLASEAARELGNADPAAALVKAREAQTAAGQIASEMTTARAGQVGVPLWSMVMRQRGDGVEALVVRLSAEEPESARIWAADEKKTLAYLDGSNSRLRGDEEGKLRAMRTALGGNDADLNRWSKRFLPQPGQGWIATLGGEAKLEMVWIAAGSFKMGSPDSEAGRDDDEVLHDVKLTAGYWLGKYEVTQGQWQAVMGTSVRQQRDKDNPSHLLVGEGGNLPMYYVSWEEAMAFCRRVTEQARAAGRLPEDYVYSLPTEAQWEYAARAGTSSMSSQGNFTFNENYVRATELDGIGWYAANSTVEGSDQTWNGTWIWKYLGKAIEG